MRIPLRRVLLIVSAKQSSPSHRREARAAIYVQSEASPMHDSTRRVKACSSQRLAVTSSSPFRPTHTAPLHTPSHGPFHSNETPVRLPPGIRAPRRTLTPSGRSSRGSPPIISLPTSLESHFYHSRAPEVSPAQDLNASTVVPVLSLTPASPSSTYSAFPTPALDFDDIKMHGEKEFPSPELLSSAWAELPPSSATSRKTKLRLLRCLAVVLLLGLALGLGIGFSRQGKSHSVPEKGNEEAGAGRNEQTAATAEWVASATPTSVGGASGAKDPTTTSTQAKGRVVRPLKGVKHPKLPVAHGGGGANVLERRMRARAVSFGSARVGWMD